LKISSVKLYAFALPLHRPLTMGGQTIDRRRGLLLELSDGNGHTGFGEAAPLPGFQKETVNDCRDQLLRIAKEFAGKRVVGNILELNGALSSFLPESRRLYPAVRFALESALVNLAADIKGKILAEAINEDFSRQVRVNGLLMGHGGDAAAQAKTLAAQKYFGIKMKVGRAAPEKDRAQALAVLQALPFGMTLRLDANRAWSLDEALEFAHGLPVQRIEYIEEPLRESGELDAFYRRTFLPYALDESLLEIEPEEIAAAAGLAAFVIKPAFLGSLEQSKQLISLATELGAQAVVSDAFGSGVTLSVLTALAAAYIPADTPMGLDAYRLLKDDILRERLQIRGGKIDVTQCGRRAQLIQFNRLEKIL